MKAYFVKNTKLKDLYKTDIFFFLAAGIGIITSHLYLKIINLMTNVLVGFGVILSLSGIKAYLIEF